MAYKVVWSGRAVEDVNAIATYIARDSPSYAGAIVHKIMDTTRNLSNFPLTGSPILEFDDPNVREKYAYGYRIVYRIDDETVTVAAVVHGKKLLELDF